MCRVNPIYVTRDIDKLCGTPTVMQSSHVSKDLVTTQTHTHMQNHTKTYMYTNMNNKEAQELT